MLLRNYKMTVAPPECLPSEVSVAAWITFDDDLSELLPYLNAELGPCVYDRDLPLLRFRRDGKLFAVYSKQIGIAGLRDEEEAEEVFGRIREAINSIAERKSTIEPSDQSIGEVKPLDIFKLLPRTNCGKCGVATCMALAAAIASGDAAPDECPVLSEDQWAEKRSDLLGLFRKNR